MKTLLCLLLGITCLTLVSCLEISEETEIKEDGSGLYVTTMDMGQLIDMMQAMGGDEIAKKKNEKIDSVAYFKDFIDTTKNLTSEQKDLLRPGSISVKMDMSQKIFRIDMKLPFKSLADLQKITAALAQGKIGFGKMLNDVMDEKKSDQEESEDLEKLMNIFDTEIKDGSIKRKVSEARYKKLMEDPKLAEMKQGADMGIEVTQRSTYKLPRPAKKVDHAHAEISDDKKTITIETDLMEIFDSPKKFEYKIEY
jgi:predicted transglutaminase-like protease